MTMVSTSDSDPFTPDKLREAGLGFPGQALTWALQNFLLTHPEKKDDTFLPMEPKFTAKEGSGIILLFGLSDLGQKTLINHVVKYYVPSVSLHWVKRGVLPSDMPNTNRSVIVIEDFDEYEERFEAVTLLQSMANPDGPKAIILLSSRPWKIKDQQKAFLEQAFKIYVPQPTDPQKAALLDIFLLKQKKDLKLETTHSIKRTELEELVKKGDLKWADWTSFRCIAFNAYERACYRKFSLDIGFSTGTLPENVRKSLVVEKEDVEKAVLDFRKEEGESETKWSEEMNEFLEMWPIPTLPVFPARDEFGWEIFKKPDRVKAPMSYWEMLVNGLIELIETSF